MKLYIRRGTKAQLNLITLDSSELGFTTDTKEVYVGDGEANHLIGKVIINDFANIPSFGVSGRVFFASDQQIPYLDTGTSWVQLFSINLDDVVDGIVYGKILKTEIDTGRIKQIYSVSSELTITGDQINNHLTNSSTHRTINDLGNSTIDLWSADKISSEITNKLSGMAWYTPAIVLNMRSDANQGGTEPIEVENGISYIVNNWGGTYVDNDIYEWNDAWVRIGAVVEDIRIVVCDIGALGSFAGQEDNIADFYNSTWNFISPVENGAIVISGNGSLYENKGFTYSGTEWINFTGAVQLLPDETSIILSNNKLSVELVDGGSF